MDAAFHLIFSPHPQVLFRFINSLNSEFEDSQPHYLPFVEQMKTYRTKFESFNKDVLKYKKMAEMLNEMDKELQFMEKDEMLRLTLKNIISTNRNLQQSLSQLEPMMRQQIEQIKSLADYICPPTEEAFRQRVLDLLDKASVEKLPDTASKTCVICMESQANIAIKRHCTVNPHTTTTPNSSHSASATTTTSTSRHRKALCCANFACACGPTMCKECFIKNYWITSINSTKSFSTCACCRSEYCLKDIHLVQYVAKEREKDKEDITTIINNINNYSSSSSSGNSNKKRKDTEPNSTASSSSSSSSQSTHSNSPKKKQRNESTSSTLTSTSTATRSSPTTSTTTTTTTTTSSTPANNRHNNNVNNNNDNSSEISLLLRGQRSPHSNQHHRGHSRFTINDVFVRSNRRDNVINVDYPYSSSNNNTNTTTSTTNNRESNKKKRKKTFYWFQPNLCVQDQNRTLITKFVNYYNKKNRKQQQQQQHHHNH
ncbi:hypothetical protein PPL_05748 [Heterostelium album PN500]|uniref:Uncharacterized protein n=1 Tax=Heterostelium pallidum (strain ATCC 26659 / Pp 5 / PN500) TaxID=670386 RepID=D3BB17_HETP5|nr:hypothetical protein PPL_05748 [Heterostelium album PN500]EFA81754.1 hypothetical protein PPL_05748 [Heterostelium album PN500]|eukprot:XP_020433871.1 hypothetical protein PPL_05748 [Heterostelium album PN500]